MRHTDCGANMIGVELQCLMADVGSVFKSLLSELGDGPLVPSFGKVGGFVDQCGCLANGLGVLIVLIQPAQPRHLVLLTPVAVAPPKLPNATIRQEAHAA